MYRYLSLLLSLTLSVLCLNAQNDCNYQLILNDAGEDGWNGAGLTFYVEGVATLYTTNVATETIDIPVLEGDSISLTYESGPVNADNNFQLLDSDGQVLMAATNPTVGVLYEGYASCPICPAIVLGSVMNVDSFDNRVMVSWEPSDSLGVYQIEYARCGFLTNPDSVLVTMTTVSSATISGLAENTCYEYQISLVCTGGTQSIASGPHVINTIFTTDVGISGAFAPQFGQKCNFLEEDTLFVFLKNYGAAPQTFVPFDFTITQGLSQPGGMVTMPEDGFYTGVLTKDSCVAFPFEELIDIAEPGEYTITMYTSLMTDSNPANDTTTYVFSHTQLLPFFENFDDNLMPERWTSDEENVVFAGMVTSELDPLNSRFILTTDRYGRISATDSLGFDFALVDLASGDPATLSAGDQLMIEVSTTCGENYELLQTIDMSNFDNSIVGAQRIKIALGDYENEMVNFRFTALRGGSSFRLILDNINVYECGVNASLMVDNSVMNSIDGIDNGSILVGPAGGITPYTFQWSTGFMDTGATSFIGDLAAGLYSVTVTDALGDCFIVEDYEVELQVATTELADLVSLDIYPNPAHSTLNVNIMLESAQALEVNIFNTLGQSMWSTSLDTELQHNLPISVSNFNTGIYFIQLSSTSGQITRRFIVD